MYGDPVKVGPYVGDGVTDSSAYFVFTFCSIIKAVIKVILFSQKDLFRYGSYHSVLASNH
jgi:hypothetical protein